MTTPSVRRFDLHGEEGCQVMRPDQDGDYVLYADHDAVVQQQATVERERDELYTFKNLQAEAIEMGLKALAAKEAQLPEEMKHCTIVFKECEKGYGMADVSEMKAGRELDTLVAEKVMGLQLMRWTNHPTFEPVVIRGDGRCNRCGWPLFDNPEKGCTAENCSMRPMPDYPRIPDYSTSIAAAWEVVEKVQLFNSLALAQQDGTWEKPWAVIEQGEDGDMISEAVTAPLAICLAALKAVGYE